MSNVEVHPAIFATIIVVFFAMFLMSAWLARSVYVTTCTTCNQSETEEASGDTGDIVPDTMASVLSTSGIRVPVSQSEVECSVDADCGAASEAVCDTRVGRCTSACFQTSECATHLSCSSSLCAECSMDTECAGSAQCFQGVCSDDPSDDEGEGTPIKAKTLWLDYNIEVDSKTVAIARMWPLNRGKYAVQFVDVMDQSRSQVFGHGAVLHDIVDHNVRDMIMFEGSKYGRASKRHLNEPTLLGYFTPELTGNAMLMSDGRKLGYLQWVNDTIRITAVAPVKPLRFVRP